MTKSFLIKNNGIIQKFKFRVILNSNFATEFRQTNIIFREIEEGNRNVNKVSRNFLQKSSIVKC